MGPGGGNYESMRPLPGVSKPQLNSFSDLAVRTKDL